MRHGLLLIDKPTGITSHDVVAMVRKALSEPKAGHAGTLDPMATGLLAVFVGRKALKVIELFMKAPKEYEARIRLGAVSSTYDCEGVIEEMKEKKGWSPPSQVQVNEVLMNQFMGNLRQTPPLHSALHIDGKRAYDIVREDPDTDLILPARDITITGIQLVSYGYPHACIRIACSSGTYIRSIAHDLGSSLRCGAYLMGLRRTKVGTWDIKAAQSLEKASWGNVIPLKEILKDFPSYTLSDAQWKDVSHGRMIHITSPEPEVIAWHDDLPVAILQNSPHGAHPRKVL